MRINFCCFSLFCGILAALPGQASPIQTTFTGVNGANAFGYYIGAYSGQLDGQNVSLFCDDFANEVTVGQQWTANLSTITTGSDLSNTRYGDVAGAAQTYQQVAWLDTQFSQQSTAQWADIHATIWQYFDPTAAPTPSSDYWMKQAQQNYSSIGYDNFRVVTNVGPVAKTGQVQEFITMVSPSSAGPVATPEPASAFLIGSSLLLAAFAVNVFQKKRSAQR